MDFARSSPQPPQLFSRTVWSYNSRHHPLAVLPRSGRATLRFLQPLQVQPRYAFQIRNRDAQDPAAPQYSIGIPKKLNARPPRKMF